MHFMAVSGILCRAEVKATLRLLANFFRDCTIELEKCGSPIVQAALPRDIHPARVRRNAAAVMESASLTANIRALS